MSNKGTESPGMVAHSHQQRQMDAVRSQSPQQQLDRRLSFFLSAASTKSIKMVPNKRRPIKKRMRPQFQPQLHQLVSPTTTTMRKPESLNEESPPLPATRMLQYIPTALDTSKTPVLMEEDNILSWSEDDDDTNSASICVEKTAPKPVPVGVTPPRLQRRKGSFFARTVRHKNFLEQQSARAAQEAADRFMITSSSNTLLIRSFKVSVPQAGESIFRNSAPSKKCLMEDDVNDGEMVYEHINIDEFYKAFNESKHRAAAFAAQIAPQLAKTDSDSMCTMMKDLFEPASRCNSLESATVMYNTTHPQQTQAFQNSPQQHSSFSSCMDGQHQQKGGDIIDDAFATMQFPMIATPKRSLRFKKNSFASFASSASGSSRSSCVTPSPAKRMIASRINTDIVMPRFDHRQSRSMGSLDGLSDTSVQPSKDGFLVSPPAFPELLDPINALRFVTKNSKLSEEQKVDQAKQFLVIPPKLKPKLPPRHVGRTLSGTEDLRKIGENGIFGSKRSLSEEMEWVMKGPAFDLGHSQHDVSGGAAASLFPGQQDVLVPVAQNGMADFRHLQQQPNHWHQHQLYGHYCDAPHGFDHSHCLPQTVNMGTNAMGHNPLNWIYPQQPTLDPFHPPSGGGRTVDRSNPTSGKISSRTMHRSISQI